MTCETCMFYKPEPVAGSVSEWCRGCENCDKYVPFEENDHAKYIAMRKKFIKRRRQYHRADEELGAFCLAAYKEYRYEK